MILITGAAGKTGQAVIRALIMRGTAVRALVHKETQIQIVQDLGVQEIVVGDMGSQNAMIQAFQDVDAVYHICPNVNPRELDIGKVMIKAAQSAGVKRFVYHSVFHPHIEAMPHHWQKMRVEGQLFESGLAYTILQPAPYMQNSLAYWPDMVQTLSNMFRYYEQFGYIGNSRILACLLNRPPTSFAAFVEKTVGDLAP